MYLGERECDVLDQFAIDTELFDDDGAAAGGSEFHPRRGNHSNRSTSCCQPDETSLRIRREGRTLSSSIP